MGWLGLPVCSARRLQKGWVPELARWLCALPWYKYRLWNNNLIYANLCKKRNHFQLSYMLMLFYISLTFILGASQLWVIHICFTVHQDPWLLLLHLAFPAASSHPNVYGLVLIEIVQVRFELPSPGMIPRHIQRHTQIQEHRAGWS